MHKVDGTTTTMYLKAIQPNASGYIRLNFERFDEETQDNLIYAIMLRVAFCEAAILYYYELEGAEAAKASRVVVDRLKAEAVTKHYEVSARLPETVHEIFGRALDDIKKYVHAVKREAIAVTQHLAITHRIDWADDDRIFSGDTLRVGGVEVSREALTKAREQGTQTIVNALSGREYHAFFALAALWLEKGGPHEIEIPAIEFARRCGFTETQLAGRTRKRTLNSLRDQFYGMHQRGPFRIAVGEPKSNTFRLDRDCYMPTLRETRIQHGGSNPRIVWEFSNFDELIFPRVNAGRFHKIYLRPLRHILDVLGRTIAGDKASEASTRILLELSFGRRKPFEMSYESLHLTWEHFNRHAERRKLALEALREGMAKLNIRLEYDRTGVQITPQTEGSAPSLSA